MACKKTAKLGPDFDWKMLKEANLEQLEDFVMDFYVKDEPIHEMMKVEPSEVYEHQRQRIKERLAENASVAIVENTSGKLIAISMNIVRTSEEVVAGASSVTLPPAKTSRIYDLLHKQFTFDMPGNLKEKRMYLQTLAVDSDYRRMGFMTSMIAKCEDLAKEFDCKYIISFTSSTFAQKTFQKRKYTKFSEVNLADLVDPDDGEKVLKTPHPIHTHATAYYKQIQ
ncbi:unnamed protein product [Clavelina lepadiformis]|uniref:N-acetyltransferase domain-containing protein n=1 Tax=Clavelina lepadiformis TaxID=159417 RepID=A0ABP0GWU6_CLALP